jgi:hypothetical protein
MLMIRRSLMLGVIFALRSLKITSAKLLIKHRR